MSEIEVGDRVTYKSFEKTRITLVMYDYCLDYKNVEILKIERIGEKRLVYSIWKRRTERTINRRGKRVFETVCKDV